MVLLCSTWCGPTWQSGEWISLVAPNSHRWRRKKSSPRSTQVAVVTQRLNALAAAFQISYAGLIRL